MTFQHPGGHSSGSHEITRQDGQETEFQYPEGHSSGFDGTRYQIGPKRDYGKVKLEISKLGEPRSRELIGRRLLSGVLAGLAYPDRYNNPLTETERRLANDLLRVLKGLDSKDYDALCRVVTGHVLIFLNNYSAGETDPVQWVPVEPDQSGEDEKVCLTR